MLLTIARHAWAGHFGDPGWADDSLRELTPDGRERYRRVVRRLIEEFDFAPELLATSPYTRCRQTATILADELQGTPRVVEVDALACGADLAWLCDWSNQQAAEQNAGHIAWVGHNPDVEVMTETLAGLRSGSVVFKKGALAQIEFAGPVAPGAGELVWHKTAKALGV